MLHVAFFEPRIPGNTGSAIRLAAGTGSTLHLVEPLGFDLSEAKLRRAGLDYHDLAHVVVHKNLGGPAGRRSRAGSTPSPPTRPSTTPTSRTAPDDVLLFGPEPTGLPADVLEHPRITGQVRIPMLPGRRSMNLSNAAAVATYEAWRQLGFEGGV